jgi:lysine decarboxylase
MVLDGPDVDPVKLTLVLSGTGADGNAVEQDLITAGLPVESADRDVLIAIVTIADPRETVGRLADTLALSIERHRGVPRPVVGPVVYAVEPTVAVPPREAFFATAEAVPADDALGRVSAELIAPYPPGIPVLAPGEEVTATVLDALHDAHAAGVRIAYAADPTLSTIRVVRR